MTLYERLDKEYITAYKAHETEKVGVLRLLKSAVKNKLVDLKRPGGVLSDEEMLEVILKQAKQRTDSIEQYTAANRKDLADKEAAELKILEEWLPAKLSTTQLEEAIRTTIGKIGASSMKDMGKVMREVLSAYPGQVDGKEVYEKVKEILTGLNNG